MFALDLFNTRFERDLREGAVDDLEGRRIDDLNAKMQDLLGRARNASPEMKAGLKREFDKVKDERDSYFKVRNETMGYGTLVGEEGIPGNVPAEKIPGKEDLLKGKGRTYYEGDVTPVKGGIRHHAKPGNYGGYEPEADPLARLDKHAVNRADKAMGVKFDREKKYQGGLDLEVDEAGIPGSVPTEKIPGKEDLLKGKGRSYYEADQKKNLDLSKGVIPTEPLPEHGGGVGPKQHWQDLMQENRLAVGDPIVVTGPNEFEGKTGEIDQFSPSGTFVIVNLYNHGKHSMHLSDIAYNEYADQEQDEEDDWYDDEEVEEGWSNKMVAQRTGQAPTPYSVYIKGKEWKSFPDDDHAENVANKLRAKFKADGRDPSVITIAATDYDKMDESATAPIIVPKRRAKEKPEPKFHIPFTADDYVPPAVAMARDEEQKKKGLKEFAPSPDYNGGGEPDRFPRIPQKFHKGDVVWVSAAKSKMRSHFPGNCPAVVLGSYDDQYGDDMVYVDVDLDDPDLSAEDREYYINDAKRKAAEEHQYDIYLLHNREVGETAWYPESGMTAVPAGTNVEQLFTKGDAVPYAKVPAKIKKIIANKLGQQGVAEGDKYEPAPDLISLDSIPGLNHGGLPKAKTRLGQGGNVGIQAPDKTKTRGQVNNFKDRLKQKLGMDEDANDTYNIIRTNGHGKKDVFAGNYSLEQAKDELAKCLAHPLHTKYGHKFAIVKRKEQGVAETDETSWTANSAQFRKEEDLSWPVEITLEPKDDINRGRGAQVKTMTVTGQSRDAAKKKLVDYYRKNGWAVTGIKFTGDLDEGSFAHDQLKGEITDLFKPVVLQIVKWARAEGMTAKDLAGTSSHFFLDALDPDTYDRTQHLPDNYFNKLMDKANAKAVEILKNKAVAEAIVASGPSQPLDDRAVRKLVWDTMKINADTGDQAIQRALSVLAKKPQSRMVQDLQDKFQNLADRLSQGLAEARPITSATDTMAGAKKLWQYIGRNLEDLASNADFDAERNELYIDERLNNLFKTADGQPIKVAFDMSSGVALDKGILYIPIGSIWKYRGMYTSEKFINDVTQALSGQAVSEAETDYSKRRQRERDVDAGKPVAKQRPSKMTDYQKKRAQDKKDMALGEDQDTSGVESAIIRRIMVAHTDLLRQFGPEKVMQAAEEVAYNVGDVDEIGTSDVSAYVAQVKQILGVPEELDEKWSQKYKSSINCANPKGFSQRAHCAGKKK